MDQNFRADVEAALGPRRGMSCGFGSSAPGSKPCKEPKCGRSEFFLFAGSCSNCAPQHGINILFVGAQAATPEAPDAEDAEAPVGSGTKPLANSASGS